MFRLIDCGTWDDPWFSELSPHAKLFFLYLITNRRTNPAGVFEITLRAASFETNLVVDEVKNVLEEMGDRVVWWPDYQVIWIRNFYRHQKANDKFRLGAVKALAVMPDDVQALVTERYPELIAATDTPPLPTGEGMDTPPIPITEGMDTDTILETVTGAVTVTESGTDTAPSGGAAAPPVSEKGPPKQKSRTKPVSLVPAENSPPFRLFQVMCEETGSGKDGVPKREKEKQLGIAKRLLDDGHSEEDVRACLRWLQTWWTKGPIDLGSVNSQIGKWVMAGRPSESTPPPRASPIPVARNGAGPYLPPDQGIDWDEEDRQAKERRRAYVESQKNQRRGAPTPDAGADRGEPPGLPVGADRPVRVA